ncbi:AAA family ATPase (plasmid) [Acaryochloris sp. 'Moss Beach']|uniref:P-loop NTPase fold protein n=1 Tax=Acaryochloris sp. 'Moss Beach' TaxID=2740837 RepID=UPI001F212A6B|nr:P-loop NTPase fold protein [Acaryochloris sp. 'Moss Beach']UJB73256.1 AAA family ATPase [Acaryochloris sp. 'Moss Beach']
MAPELRQFFRACNPGKTIRFEDPEERQYYIDFSSIRGGEVIEELGQTIALMDPDPTCQLFSGHIGCGKSTELLRLKAELQDKGFHVVYFESSEDLDMGDVDVSDILLAIAHQVSESLEAAKISTQSSYFTGLLQECVDFLKTPVELGVEAELSLGIGKLTAKTKESPQLRSQLRQYLEPRTESLLSAINRELLQPAQEELTKQGKQGLVVIIDNLDRVDNRRIASGQTQSEYLFITRGEQLGGLQCHVVYTIPLVLMFSNELQTLKNRLGGGTDPMVLPMVPIRLRDGNECQVGMAQLRQMALARAFPNATPEERLAGLTEVFDSPDILDQLCIASGGHVRNLLSLLFACLRKRKSLPITQDSLNLAIQQARDDLTATIDGDEWALLKQVTTQKKVNGEDECQALLRSLFVFEYRNDADGRWFDINPVLAGARELS